MSVWFPYTSLSCAVCTKNETSIWNKKPSSKPFYGKYCEWVDNNGIAQRTGYCSRNHGCEMQLIGKNCTVCMWNHIGYGFSQKFCSDCPGRRQKPVEPPTPLNINITADAEAHSLPPCTQPTAEVVQTGNHLHFIFGIPKCRCCCQEKPEIRSIEDCDIEIIEPEIRNVEDCDIEITEPETRNVEDCDINI